jgi:Zn-dependent protease
MNDLWGSSQERKEEEPQEPQAPPTPPEPLFGSQYELRHYDPIQPKSGFRELLRKLATPFIALGVLLAKFKFVIFFVFKLKFFATAGTMLLSIGAYALFFGWPFAVGFVVLIFVHEMGHVIELRRQGVKAGAPLFIPFLGAMIGMKQMPHNAWKEARVGLAGPILGSVGAAACWLAGWQLDSNLLRALAFVGFFLNLFNLLPFLPLDGGRAVAALHPAIWGVGLVAVAGLAFLRPNPILILILVFGAMELWRRWKSRHDPAYADYYKVTIPQRLTIATTYFGLAAALAAGMYELRNIPH